MAELTAEQQDWRLEAREQRAMAESATARARAAEAATRRVARERDERQGRIDAAIEEYGRYPAASKADRMRLALQGDQPVESERVPCGNPNSDCGFRGGSARCGGCTT